MRWRCSSLNSAGTESSGEEFLRNSNCSTRHSNRYLLPVLSSRRYRRHHLNTKKITKLDALTTHSHLIPPHGGELINLIGDEERGAKLKPQSRDFPSWDLTARHIRDLE